MTKNILITGASGNLGKATVERFLSGGHRIIATVSPAKKLGFDIQGDIQTIEADLTNEHSVNNAIASIISNTKSIDAAVLLVGGFAMGGIRETDGTSLKKMLNLNFDTAYFCARQLFLQMERQPSGGRIVLIGARPALQPEAGKDALAYALSKSLLFKLAEFLNEEGASKNIVTSVVVPSIIDTSANRSAMPNADFSSWVTPEAIAEVISFTVLNSVVRHPVYKVYGNA